MSALVAGRALDGPMDDEESTPGFARCLSCGVDVPTKKAHRQTVCDDCAHCKCGSGKPPALCHGVTQSGFKVPLVDMSRYASRPR